MLKKLLGFMIMLIAFTGVSYSGSINSLLKDINSYSCEIKSGNYTEREKWLAAYYAFDANFLVKHTNYCSHNPITKSVADYSELKDIYEYINGDCLLPEDVETQLLHKYNVLKKIKK